MMMLYRRRCWRHTVKSSTTEYRRNYLVYFTDQHAVSEYGAFTLLYSMYKIFLRASSHAALLR